MSNYKEIHKQLGTTWLSKIIEERQLRYFGHMQRYPDERWVKFASRAERPTQQNTGKVKQWKKKMSKMLKKHQLKIQMTQNKEEWRKKLNELFERNESITQWREDLLN